MEGIGNRECLMCKGECLDSQFDSARIKPPTVQHFACKFLHGFTGPLAYHRRFTPSCHNTVFAHIRYYIHPPHPFYRLISRPPQYIVVAAANRPPSNHPYTAKATPWGGVCAPAEELPPTKISLPNGPPNTPLLCLNLSPISVLVVPITTNPSNVHSLTQLFTPYTPFYQFPICPAPYPTLSYFCFIFDALLRHFCVTFASFMLQKRPKMLHIWCTNVLDYVVYFRMKRTVKTWDMRLG